MGNVLRFPMNVSFSDNILAAPQAAPDAADAPESTAAPHVHAPHVHDPHAHDMNPLGEGLLAHLTDVRDRLTTTDRPVDDEVRRECLDAVEAALNAAMDLERTVLRQRLHIEDMARVACTDPLTGIYNRRGFEQEFHRVLAAATRFEETGVLVYIDLDGFKPINDTYGHAAGDAVLTEVARVLYDHVRPQDLVARIGGDEFTVLLTRTSWEDGLARAEALKHLLNTTYVRIDGKNIAVRASLGFQRYGADADADLLLDKADSAMFEAKRLRGKGRPDTERPNTELTD